LKYRIRKYMTKYDCGTVYYNERVLLCKYVDGKVLKILKKINTTFKKLAQGLV